MAKKQSDLDAALVHRYRVVSNGPTVPGVTTVISNSNPIRALPWSAAKISAEFMAAWMLHPPLERSSLSDAIDQARKEPDKQWKAKAARGTRVHDVAERWTRGETVDVSHEDSGFVDALENFHTKFTPKFHDVERVVLNYWSEYGGRIDAVCEFDGGTFLLDWKTGSYYPYEVALQMAAYMEARIAEYDAEGNLLVTDSFPLAGQVDGARVVYLRQDGTFEIVDPFEAVPHTDAILAFSAALQLYNVKRDIEQQIAKGKKNGTVPATA